MGQDDEFYTAWDGRQYPGRPPSGWFLAADNRWWPSANLIEGEVRNEPAGDNITTDPAPSPTEAPPGRPDPIPPAPASSPPASWAPESSGADGPLPPSVPGSGAGTPPTASGGRRPTRRGGRFRIWPIVFVIFMISRCGIFESDEPATPDTQTEEEVVTIPADQEDYTNTVNCFDGFLTGSITNDSEQRATFVIGTVRPDGGQDYQSGQLSVAPDQTRTWTIQYGLGQEEPSWCPPTRVYIVG